MDALIYYNVTGSGIPVMLVHGFGEDASIWEHQAAVLQNHCTLLIPDLHGTGKSSDYNLPASIEEMADDLAAILDAEKIDACVMLGHSMGGYITLAFAERYPERLLGFGLLHSTTYADTVEKKSNRTKAIALIKAHGSNVFLKTAIPNLFSEAFNASHPEVVAAVLQNSSKLAPPTLIAHYEAIMARPDRTAILENSKVPVLMIIGMQDKVVPPEDALKQSELSPLCSTCILAEVAHMGMLEATEKVNVCLLEFVSTIAKNNAS